MTNNETRSAADFIPGVEPYEFLTEVELRPAADGGTHVTMTAAGRTTRNGPGV